MRGVEGNGAREVGFACEVDVCHLQAPSPLSCIARLRRWYVKMADIPTLTLTLTLTLFSGTRSRFFPAHERAISPRASQDTTACPLIPRASQDATPAASRNCGQQLHAATAGHNFCHNLLFASLPWPAALAQRKLGWAHPIEVIMA